MGLREPVGGGAEIPENSQVWRATKLINSNGNQTFKSFSGHMSRIPDKPDQVGQPEDLSLRLSSEERDWKKEAASLPSLPSPPPRATLPPALATKREALQKRPPRIKVYFLRTCSSV